MNEEKIIETLTNAFPFMEDTLQSPSKSRVVTPPLERKVFEEVFNFAVKQAGFGMFHLIIGLDEGENLGFIYVLSNKSKILLMMKQVVPKDNPAVKSICGIFPNALWHEREIVDLFGAVVEDLPPGPNYPLPDGWPAGNYPLLKDWKVEYFDRVNMTYNPPPEKEAEHAE